MLSLNSLNLSEPLAFLELIVVIFIAWLSTSTFLSWHRLRHVPGPMSGSLSYFWLIRNSIYGCSAEEFLAVQKYGTLVRIGPNYVVSGDPTILRHINAASSGYHRHYWYNCARWDIHQESVLSTLDTATHDRLKARLAAGYSGRDNVGIEENTDAMLQKLIGIIRQKYLSGNDGSDDVKEVDLVSIIASFTIDAITRLSYGEEFGFLDNEEDIHEYSGSLERFARIVTIMADVPLFRWIATSTSSPVPPLIMPTAKDKSGVGKILK